jgi:uncharacterized protein (DUF1501 family)
MERRNFIKKMGLTMASAPIVMNNMNLQAIQTQLFKFAKSAEDRVLIIIRLNGGNDGLNTVIPMDQYANLVTQRQNILIPQNKVLTLSQSNLALHPSMTGMRDLFEQGKLSIVQNVGYPEQNRSHFRSMDIWSRGSTSNDETRGWLGRHLDDYYPNYPDAYPNSQYPDPFAISMGYNVSETCQGLMANFSQAIANPFDSFNLPTNTVVDDGTYYGSHLAYLSTLIKQTNSYGQRIHDAATAGNTLSTMYDANNPLAVQLRYVAQMISGGLQTKIYILNVDGFDTHSAQVEAADVTTGIHATLLSRVSSAIAAFQDDLTKLSISNRVAGFTFSEFGRQIASNASHGSDHGDAAPLFLFGECISTSVIGPNPVISNTVSNQAGVAMKIDFRDVYASLLKDWFLVPESDITPLFEHTITYLDLLGACNADLGISEKNNKELYLYPNPASDYTNLRFEAKGSRYSLRIIDMNGRIVKEVFKDNLLSGEQKINLNVSDLTSGFYAILLEDDFSTKSIKLIVVK